VKAFLTTLVRVCVGETIGDGMSENVLVLQEGTNGTKERPFQNFVNQLILLGLYPPPT